MIIESDWAERVRRFVSDYDEQTVGHPLAHRENLDRFIATEEIVGWQQFQDRPLLLKRLR
ncbi:MAG: hypothetical protein ACLQU1_39585 [Bryobacteraceae bacterium]